MASSSVGSSFWRGLLFTVQPRSSSHNDVHAFKQHWRAIPHGWPAAGEDRLSGVDGGGVLLGSWFFHRPFCAAHGLAALTSGPSECFWRSIANRAHRTKMELARLSINATAALE